MFRYRSSGKVELITDRSFKINNMDRLAQESKKLSDFEQQVDPEDGEQQELLGAMRSQLKKLQAMRRNEDPRLSFSTPEFKEAQRTFTDNFKVR